MAVSPLAGKPALKSMLVDLVRLERDYYERQPDVADANQLVSFGTSGHRGTSLDGTFTEAHILAITQAICEFRAKQGTNGPLFMGKDTHALSAPAWRAAVGWCQETAGCRRAETGYWRPCRGAAGVCFPDCFQRQLP
jgi:phosphoglucomutase